MDKLKALNLCQYVFSSIYLTLLLFTPFGTLELRISDLIVYVIAPEGGYPQDVVLNLNLGFFGKFLMIAITVADLIIIYFQNVKLVALNIFICSIRVLHPLMYLLIGILLFFVNNELFTIKITIFGYLFIIICIASLLCHCARQKILKRADISQVNC